jgi:two-component system, OmpR family, response regulator
MRLLVVEDESRLALLLKRGLEEQGYVVDVTGDGEETLWLATESSYDTIVLDVMLPSLDGLEVTTRLRAGRRAAAGRGPGDRPRRRLPAARARGTVACRSGCA